MEGPVPFFLGRNVCYWRQSRHNAALTHLRHFLLKGQTEWAQVPVWPTSLHHLLTGWTVGSLELNSLLADADHFIHRKQTLCLDVTNTIR